VSARKCLAWWRSSGQERDANRDHGACRFGLFRCPITGCASFIWRGGLVLDRHAVFQAAHFVLIPEPCGPAAPSRPGSTFPSALGPVLVNSSTNYELQRSVPHEHDFNEDLDAATGLQHACVMPASGW
jgi:hypothetical protein